MDQDFVKLAEAIGDVSKWKVNELFDFIRGWARGDKKFNFLIDTWAVSPDNYLNYVKESLTRLTTARTRKEILNEAAHLKEVVSTLSDEHPVYINLGDLGGMEIISLSWQDGLEMTDIDTFNEREFWNRIRKYLASDKIVSLKQRFQKQIDDVIASADALADELGEDRQEFFCEHCLP